MADSRNMRRVGWWANNADALLSATERIDASVPASISRSVGVRVAAQTADSLELIEIAPIAGVIVSAKFAWDAAGSIGPSYLVNGGTTGSVPLTVGAYSIARAVVGSVPVPITLAATCNFPAGAVIQWKRTTTGADSIGGAGVITVEYAPDITAQSHPIAVAPADIVIKRVAFIPETTYGAGAISLVNMGSVGTLNNTVATKAAAALTSLTPYTLGITGSYSTVGADQQLIFKRATASGDKTMSAGRVEVEYNLLDYRS